MVPSEIGESGMTALSRYRMVRPRCRYCGRDWVPPSYVSADASYCNDCKGERAETARLSNPQLAVFIGRDGSKVVMPAGRSYGLREAKKP